MLDARLRRGMVRIADRSISMARLLRGHPWAVLTIDQMVAAKIDELDEQWNGRLSQAALHQVISTLLDVRRHARAIASGADPEPDRWPQAGTFTKPGRGAGLRRGELLTVAPEG